MAYSEEYLNKWRSDLENERWDFGHGAFRQSDPEFVKKAHEAQKILDQADLEKPFGALAYANAEAMKFGTEAVPAAQNAVAASIASAYDLILEKGRDRLGYKIGKEEFFNAYPQQRQRVLNVKLPENPAFLRQALPNGRTVGQYYPQLAQAKTVGDLQDWLVSTVDPGLRTAAAGLSGKGQNFEDVYQAARLGVMGSISTYEPVRFTAEGERRTNQFLIHAGWGAYKASKDYMRFEKGFSQVSGSSLDALGEDTASPFRSLSDAGLEVPQYQPGFENALLNAQKAGNRWGTYGPANSRASTIQLGNVAGTWAEELGLQEGDVVPAWNAIAQQNPEVFGQVMSAMEAGKTVPFVFGRLVGATADPSGNFHLNFRQGTAFLNSKQMPTFGQDRSNWLESELRLFRQGQGVSGTKDYSYPALGMWTKPGWEGRTTYNYQDQIWVAPLRNQRTDEYSAQATITEADLVNMGTMYEQGLGDTGDYKNLQQAVAGARSYISGAMPRLGKELSGFGAVEDFDNWVVSRERRFAEGQVSGGPYELIDPDSELEKANAIQAGADPANPQAPMLGSDPELAEYYGNTPVREGATETDLHGECRHQ